MNSAKPRRRRIAADEAHAWARNLRLNNPSAKLVLSFLTLYVDGDGYCFVSIPQLADDTELSAQTVRSRLAFLEQLGAIVRQPQYLDELGRRNAVGGKRTTDQIRLMIGNDEEIEAAALGEDHRAVSREVSPMPQTGLNPSPEPPAETVSPAPALRQPYDSAEGLTSEPEPEVPPKSPSGGLPVADRLGEGEQEPEHFAPTWQAYPGHEVMRRDLGLEAFCELAPDKQRLARAAVVHYAARLKQLGQKRPMNFHLWIRAAGFEEFPGAVLDDERPKPPPRRFVQGEELAGLKVASLIAERRELQVRREQDLGEGVWRTSAHQPDLVALGACGVPSDEWPVVDVGSAEFGAWRDRLQLWLGIEPRPEKIWIEPHDPAVHGVPWNHPDFRLRRSKEGFRVPRPWPPRRDGSWFEPVALHIASQRGDE